MVKNPCPASLIALAVLLASSLLVGVGRMGGVVLAGSLKPKTEVDAPTITPTGGHYGINVSVMVAIRGESGSRIVYTLDGSIPTPSWGIKCDHNLVSVELPPGDVTVRAIAVKPGLPPSRTAKAVFTRSVGTGKGR